MYNLRRLKLPSVLVRRRPILQPGAEPRLRGGNKRLAEALYQLNRGVPLNWGQVEDDPELETLADLEPLAQECRRSIAGSLPPELREQLIERLTRRLPQAKVQEKATPRALAGFSESVTVMTQVEEDVPSLITNAPQWIAATFGAGLLVMAALWLLSSFFPAAAVSGRWVEVGPGGKVTGFQVQRNESIPRCTNFSLTDPQQKRTFIRQPDDRDLLRTSVDFPVAFLPRVITVTNSIDGTPSAQVPTGVTAGAGATATVSGTRTLIYTFQLTDMSVAPCFGDILEPQDPGATVKLAYVANIASNRRSATSTSLVIFQGRSQPVYLDSSTGTWKEVSAGGGQGVYWRGAPHRDIEGVEWIGDVSVLVMEREGVTTTMISSANQQMSEAALLRLYEGLVRE